MKQDKEIIARFLKDIVNTYCIIRTYNSGVHFGKVKALDKQTALITDCRRIWYWAGAFTLSALAENGTKKPENCKFSCFVSEILLTDVLEIIPCRMATANQIREIKAYEC